MNTLIKVLALCAALPLVSQSVAAAEPKIDFDVKAVRNLACKDDVNKLCADAEKGKKNACLKDHDKELSMECKGARMAIDFLRNAAK